MTPQATECKKCLMSETVDPRLTFSDGACQHCVTFEKNVRVRIAAVRGQAALASEALKIRRRKTKSPYDCVLGLSGGVDSSYLAYLAVDLGLNPLCVHIDNGWNSELASSNVEKLVKGLELDLYTVVLDAETFHDLQKAFLIASVPDVEIPSDHAIQASLWQTASKFRIRTILSGMNYASESSSIPHWSYGHADWKYIKSVWKLGGHPNPSRFPHFTKVGLVRWAFVKQIRSISLLNYADFNKHQAVQLLKNRLGWQEYSSKHSESVYTRWVQGFLLPEKFNIDKRYMHLSDLIRSGQLSKAEAAEELKRNHYPKEDLRADTALVLKKLGLSNRELAEILRTKPASFREFPNSEFLDTSFRQLLNLARRLGVYPR